jgi:hypothetical protein
LHEIDEGVASLSDTEIVLEYRRALEVLLPMCMRLHLLESDDQPYDDFDALARSLWQHLVVATFTWKYGAEVAPPYGRLERATEPPFVLASTGAETFQFSEFGGTREFGDRAFNSVFVFDQSGERRQIPVEQIERFELQRG